jgi:hypothetical protein
MLNTLPRKLFRRRLTHLLLAIAVLVSSAPVAADFGQLRSVFDADHAVYQMPVPRKGEAIMPVEFLGIWGMSLETCDDENIGIRLMVRADFLSLTDWSHLNWVLLVKSVAVNANDSSRIIIYFYPPKLSTKSPDFEPLFRFDKFGQMTLSNDRQTLIVTDLASATDLVFFFCSALPDPEKKAG